MSFRLGRRLLGLSAILAVAGCGAPGGGLPLLPDGQADAYRLGPGDNLRVTVFDDTRLTGEFRVNDSGNIALPLVGTIGAAGRTPSEVEAAIADAMRRANLFQRPAVAVEVLQYRPVYVLGEVSRPGEYEYKPGMTVLTAVTVAGGFTYRAFQDHVSVLRPEPGQPAQERRASRQAFLRPGDVVTVFERRF